MTIAICDDEAPVRSLIRSYILKQAEQETILEYVSGEEMVSSLRASGEDVDVLFLDISFGSSTNGMETAAQIRAMYEKQNLTECAALPVIIFVTGDDSRIPEAFQVHAFQYIVKPVDEAAFREIFQKARREVLAIREVGKSKTKKLVVQQNGMSVSVEIGDILFAESVERKVVLHLPKEAVEYYGKISDAENTLGSRFFRVHRGFLVNLDAVKRYSRDRIELTGGETVPMSRFKYQPFVEVYMRHIGNKI